MAEKTNLFKKTNAWKTYRKDEKKVEKFADEYREFLDSSKTERTCIETVVKGLKKAGFKEWSKIKSFKPGTKFYMINRSKSMVAGIVGKKDLQKEGFRYLVSHVDVPQLHLKPSPFYEDEKLVLVKTQYYGGVKKHHWLNIPLAMYGTVYLKDGSEVKIKIGDDGQNCIVIPDLAIHIDKEMNGRKYSEIVKGEELNAIVGSKPGFKKEKGKEKEIYKEHIINLLNKEYKINERDILTGEFQLVPALPSMNVGIDSSMIGGFGHDDRVCAYASMKAMVDLNKTDNTVLCYWFDREEIGSTGNTGAQSIYFEYAAGLLVEKLYKNKYSDILLKKIFEKTKGVSADVSPAMDPNFKMAYEKNNTANIGYGAIFHKYTGGRGKGGSNEVNPQYFSELTHIFDSGNIPWQINCLGKVDGGGGGTIANFLCNLNTDVVDSGLPILGLHTPYEVISKVDLYCAYSAYKAFMEKF
ncbi:MAG: aminopeptidase [Candidatus Muiribacteriota bacterium]